jgi:hypothetical protein
LYIFFHNFTESMATLQESPSHYTEKITKTTTNSKTTLCTRGELFAGKLASQVWGEAGVHPCTGIKFMSLTRQEFTLQFS